MKKIIKAIKQRIDWVFILIGSCIVVYGVLDFSPLGEGPFEFLRSASKTVHAYRYFYTHNTRVVITIGVFLLVFGVLLYKRKRIAR